jgi:proline racemase
MVSNTPVACLAQCCYRFNQDTSEQSHGCHAYTLAALDNSPDLTGSTKVQSAKLNIMHAASQLQKTDRYQSKATAAHTEHKMPTVL